MFQNAAKVAAPAAPKSKSKVKEQIKLAGVEALAMVYALTEALATVQGTLEGQVKSAASAIFAERIAATGTKPESFDAVEGIAAANVQFKKRASNQPLSPAAIELLAQYGIVGHIEVTTPKLYGINPIYGENANYASQIEMLINEGKLPGDYIVLQDEVSKVVVTDEVLKTALARAQQQPESAEPKPEQKPDEKQVPMEVLACLTSLACKPRLAQTDVEKLLDFARNLMSPVVATAESHLKAVA